MLVFLQISLPFFLITHAWERVATFFVLSTLHWWAYSVMAWCLVEKWAIGKLVRLWFHRVLSVSLKYVTYRPLLFRAGFKWRLQENRFFLVFGLIIHFMATTTKAKRCIFISRTPKCPGAGEVGGAGRRYRLFSASLRSQFGPIWILWGHGWWKLWFLGAPGVPLHHHLLPPLRDVRHRLVDLLPHPAGYRPWQVPRHSSILP